MKRRRILSVCLAFIVMLTIAAPVPAVAKAKSAGPLLKSVTTYNYERNGKKARWSKSSVTKFTYDKNGYPTLITADYGNATSQSFKYKYKKNRKPKSAKEYNVANRKTGTYKYNKNGLVTSYKDSSFLKRSSVKRTYKYNKKGFASQYIYKYSYKDSWWASSSRNTDKYRYSYKFKKGLPKTLTSNWSCTDWSSGGGSYSYSGKYFATFNGKGLITSWGYISDDGKRNTKYTVTYKKKKGKITSAIVKHVYDGTASLERKYVFSYKKKTSTTKPRYANMINDQIVGSGPYGTYNWY